MREFPSRRARWLLIAGAILTMAPFLTVGVGSAVGQQLVQGQPVSVEGGAYTDVGPADLASMLSNKDFPLINVHVPYEGEIEGTDLFLPFNEIQDHLDQLPAAKEARLVLYCRSGSMSTAAARTLVGLGYTNVWNLDGGMIGWAQAGYPLTDESR